MCKLVLGFLNKMCKLFLGRDMPLNVKLKSILVIVLVFEMGIIYAQDTCLTNLTLGISFPPVANNTERTYTKIHLDTLGVTKIRFAENWALREPVKGNFNWAPLDDRINWAYNNDYEILLTIQSIAPNWACSSVQNGQSCVFDDNNDFKKYIDSLLTRYSGKIAKIQFGNEWQSDFWYAGNAENFIAANNVLFNSVQIHSPFTKVVLGGFTTISLRFLAGCNGVVSSFYDDDGIFYDSTYLITNCPTPLIQNVRNRIDSVLQLAQYDMLDLHFYDDAEQWDEYYINFSDTITKPIIVSEFGGPNMNYETYSDSYQTNRLYLYIKKLDSLQLKEAYFFKLIEGTSNPAHSTSGLISDTTLIEKSSYYLFKSFISCHTSLHKFEEKDKVQIYPNPAFKTLTIKFEQQLLKDEQIQMYNSFGNLVLTENIKKNTTDIDISKLAKGIYIVRLKNFPQQSHKFLKQ